MRQRDVGQVVEPASRLGSILDPPPLFEASTFINECSRPMFDRDDEGFALGARSCQLDRVYDRVRDSGWEAP